MTRLSRSAPEKGPPRPPGPRWIFLYVAGIATAVFVVGSLLSGIAVRTVSYTEFKQKLRAGEIAEVVVSEARVRGTLKKSEEQVSAVRVDDPALMAELEQQGVTVTGEVPGGGVNVLIWLLPMALIFYMWTRGMRGIGDAQGLGALSFGRSRAKVYAEDDVQVTFADAAGAQETRNGIRILPDQVAANWSAERLIPAIRDQPPAKALDQALDGIAARYGMHTADFVAMQLEYPKETAPQ